MSELMMPLRQLFEWVDTFESSIAIRESQYLYPAILTSHVVSICLFAGLILMMDLRLLGVGNMQTPFSQLQRRLFPWQMLGFALSAVSGLALVYTQPMRFYVSLLFWIKVVMMGLAQVNALAFHYVTYPSVNKWDTDPVLPFPARLAGLLGLALWAGVVVSGRLVAYNWFQ